MGGKKRCEQGCECGRHIPYVRTPEIKAKNAAGVRGRTITPEWRARIAATLKAKGCVPPPLDLTPEMRAKLAVNATTHGYSRHPYYPRWSDIVRRCTRPDHPAWKNYGGRGISMAPEWMTDPGAFCRYLEGLGPRPPKYTLDRVDNNGNYEPGNLRWASRKTQRVNQRSRSECKNASNAS